MIGATIFIILLAVFVTQKASLIFDRLQKFLDRMNVVLRENVTGVRVIRAFNKESYEEKRMRKSFEDYAKSAIQANRLFAGLESIALLAINLCIVCILWLGGNRIGSGYMEIGDITALTQYAIMILFYIVMAQMVIILIPRAMICVQRISDVLHLAPEIQDGFSSLDKRSSQASDIIRFQNASFRFADASENTLGNLTFSCRKGQTTAIIGSTGSGNPQLQIDSALPRCHLRLCLTKRQGYPRTHTERASETYLLCTAKSLAILRYDCRQSQIWKS